MGLFTQRNSKMGLFTQRNDREYNNDVTVRVG